MINAALIVALTGKNQDSDGKASAVFAHMALDQKLSALESMLRLIEKQEGGLGDIFKHDVLPLIMQPKKKRNAIVHHLWTGFNGVVHRSNIEARGKLKIVSDAVSIKELVELSESVSRGRTALQDFCIVRLIPAMAAPQQGQ